MAQGFPYSASRSVSARAVLSGSVDASRDGWGQGTPAAQHSALGAHGTLRTKRLADRLVRFDVRAADEIDAIGDGGEDAVQRFLDRLGLSRQIENQCAPSNHADLTRENRGRYIFEADLAHLLAEAREHLVRDGERRFGRHVARRRTGAAGGEHEMAAGAIDEI